MFFLFPCSILYLQAPARAECKRREGYPLNGKQQLVESEYMKERLELEAEQTQALKNIDATLKSIERYLSDSANYHSGHATNSNVAPEVAVSAPEADDASDNCDRHS